MSRRKVITTSRRGVTLKQFVLADAVPAFDLIRKNWRHLSQNGDNTASKYPSLRFVRRSITHPPVSSKIRFGIWEGKRLVGSINLTPMTNAENSRNDIAEIGYWMGEEFCRRGLATTAVIALTGHALRNMRFKVITAVVRIGNIASQRVLIAAKFHWEITVGEDLYYARKK